MFSKKAYSKPKNFISENYYQNTDTDAQAYLVRKNDTQYVVFRGSNSFIDFLIDIDISPIKLHGFEIHRGFYQQMMSIAQDIMRDLDPQKPVVCCGHSLGGALATLFAYFWAMHAAAPICITFASAKVGNTDFARAYANKITYTLRFVTEDDLIPMLNTYVHVCKAICLTERGAYVQYDQPERPRGPWIRTLLRALLQHSCHTYAAYFRICAR